MTTLSAGKPLTVNSFTLIPIEESRLYSRTVFDSPLIYASKIPKALIVVSDTTPKAYDMNFNEIPVETLIEETVGLKELIKKSL